MIVDSENDVNYKAQLLEPYMNAEITCILDISGHTICKYTR